MGRPDRWLGEAFPAAGRCRAGPDLSHRRTPKVNFGGRISPPPPPRPRDPAGAQQLGERRAEGTGTIWQPPGGNEPLAGCLGFGPGQGSGPCPAEPLSLGRTTGQSGAGLVTGRAYALSCPGQRGWREKVALVTEAGVRGH